MISVILVEPQYSGNIGSVARVMKNFGFEKLILVNPCEVDEDAYIMAVHADDLIKKTEKAKSLSELRDKFDLLVGTTARFTEKDDYFLRMTLEPKDLVEKLNAAEGEIGIVFGREDSGLSNEDVGLCDFCVTIPTSGEYKSLNLSHAVAVILYEISKIKKGKKPRLASNSEKQLIFENTERIVKNINYPIEKRKVFNTMVERIIGRALITGREANTLIGVLKKINKKIK